MPALTRSLPALAPPDITFVEAPPFETMPLYNARHPGRGRVSAGRGNLGGGDPATPMAWSSCSPEYNWSIPDRSKNALDWVSRMKDNPFKDKPVALQSASTGQIGGARMQYHLRMVPTFDRRLSLGRRKSSSISDA